MRRSAALVAALALVASGVALAAPANAAVTKPGVPTALKATPNATGGVVVTWKAPVVKKGKSVKATSYTVSCTGAKKVTVKTTKATVQVVKTGYKDGVVCAVSALAGKALGTAAKTKGFTAYVQLGVASFTLTASALTGVSNGLNPVAPATLSPVAQDGSRTISFPVTAVKNGVPTNLAGAFLVGPAAIAAPINKLIIVADASSTPAAPVYDVQGQVPAVGNTIHTVLVADTFTDATHFTVKLTSDPLLEAIFPTFQISLQGGATLGTGTFQ